MAREDTLFLGLLEGTKEFIENLSPDQIDSREGQYAIQLCVGVLGEAMSNLSPEFKTTSSCIRWEDFKELKVVAVHFMGFLDLRTFVREAVEFIPALQYAVKHTDKTIGKQSHMVRSLEFYDNLLYRDFTAPDFLRGEDRTINFYDTWRNSPQGSDHNLQGIQRILEEIGNIKQVIGSEGIDVIREDNEVTFYAIQMSLVRIAYYAKQYLDESFEQEFKLYDPKLNTETTRALSWSAIIAIRDKLIHQWYRIESRYVRHETANVLAHEEKFLEMCVALMSRMEPIASAEVDNIHGDPKRTTPASDGELVEESREVHKRTREERKETTSTNHVFFSANVGTPPSPPSPKERKKARSVVSVVTGSEPSSPRFGGPVPEGSDSHR